MPRIDDTFLRCVFYVYPTTATARKGEKVGGTGFLVAKRMSPDSQYAQIYGVTNKHVVKGLPSKTIALRLNTLSGKTQVIQTMRDDWVFHEEDDLAIHALELNVADFNAAIIPDGYFLAKEHIPRYGLGPGDETFSIGRFIGHDGKQRNLPVARFGNIAMMPEEPIATSDGNRFAFLVECRSLSGFSGSPVFVWVLSHEYWRKNMGSMSFPSGPWLLGVNCGHMMIPEQGEDFSTRKKLIIQQHSAMEVVIPAWELKSLLNYDVPKQQRSEKEKEIVAKRDRGFVLRHNFISFP